MTFRMHARKAALTALGGAAIAGAAIFSSLPADTPTEDGGMQLTADAAMPYAVENFAYPGADRIQQEQNIKLKRGDGRILLTECSDTSQIQVWTRESADGKFCFRVVGASGYLTLEVPDVFALQTEDRAIEATLSAEGEEKVVEVAKDVFKGVGEGIGEAATVLLEIRVTG